MSIKRVLSFSGGLIFGGVLGVVVVGMLVLYVQSELEPVVVVLNVTQSAIPHLTVETDIGERYLLEDVLPGQSRRVKISGRDKSLWLVVTMPSGTIQKSESIYVSTSGSVYGTITEDKVYLDYEL